jgi:hypothetical protein
MRVLKKPSLVSWPYLKPKPNRKVQNYDFIYIGLSSPEDAYLEVKTFVGDVKISNEALDRLLHKPEFNREALFEMQPLEYVHNPELAAQKAAKINR